MLCAPCRMYFAGAEAVKMDARQCLAASRSRVLAGVHIVFSRIFPQLMSRPETHSLWKLATQVSTSHLIEKVPALEGAHHTIAKLAPGDPPPGNLSFAGRLQQDTSS